MHHRDAVPEVARNELQDAPARAPAAPQDGVLALQQSAGNAAVARWMLQRETPTLTATTTTADTKKVAQLRTELSAMFNIDEGKVVALMRSLSPEEVETVLSDADLKRKAIACLNDDEMYGVIRGMKGDPVKSLEWLAAQGLPKCSFVKTAQTALGDVKLDPALVAAVTKLVQHLIDNYMIRDDAVFSGIGGVREPKTAHRNSTAYFIRQGTVTLDSVKALKDGKDLDGNLWYEKGWTDAQVKAHALDVWDGEIAYEGYPPGDERRLPNGLQEPAMSLHVTGHAMDVTIPWRDGDGWHREANELVAQFGLTRPFPRERWHFELAASSQ